MVFELILIFFLFICFHIALPNTSFRVNFKCSATCLETIFFLYKFDLKIYVILAQQNAIKNSLPESLMKSNFRLAILFIFLVNLFIYFSFSLS